MKITITDLEGKVHKAKQPYGGSEHVITEMTCPHCGVENMSVSGTGKMIDPEHRHDTYRATAFHAHVECGQGVGVMRCKVSTLFGLEEDEAVFNLGTKIYQEGHKVYKIQKREKGKWKTI